jgi:hypothetical protein
MNLTTILRTLFTRPRQPGQCPICMGIGVHAPWCPRR